MPSESSNRPTRVAIIPARGGSARIPRKNIRAFLGRPILAYAVDTARASGLFDRILVSTEDEEIAALAAHCGADHLPRPLHLADDRATTDAVLAQALVEAVRQFGTLNDACCIYPTSIFTTVGDLAHGLALLEAHNAVSAFPVVRYDFPVEQALVLEGVRPRPVFPDKLLARSQDLQVHVHDAAAFYWCRVNRFLSSPALFSPDAVAFEIPLERAQDINTEDDWRRAEFKYSLLHRTAPG